MAQVVSKAEGAKRTRHHLRVKDKSTYERHSFSMKTKTKIGSAVMVGFAAIFAFLGALKHGVADVGPRCWCCHSVECFKAPCPRIVSFTSVADCQRIHGECYGSREEASRYCDHSAVPRRPSMMTCWCYIPVECFTAPCPPGRVVQTTLTDCQKHGGHCFGSQEEALSYRNRSTVHRSSRTCWCCFGSGRATTRVIQTTMTECQARGGSCYQSRKDAERDCFMRGEFH